MKPKYKRFFLRFLLGLFYMLSGGISSHPLFRQSIQILQEKIHRSKVDELNKKLAGKNSNLRHLG